MTRFEGDLSPFRRFLQRLREGITGALTGETARSVEADINAQRSAAWRRFYDFYPPEPGGRPLERRYSWGGGLHKFPSAKAQRYFFGVVLKGGNFPYRRTGRLKRSLTAGIESVDRRGFVLRIVSDSSVAPYNVYVIGGRQWYYHAETGWPLLAGILSQAVQDNPTVLADEYLGLLAGYLGGSA